MSRDVLTDRTLERLALPWPGLRESLRTVVRDLDNRSLGHLRTSLFDTKLGQSEQTLVAFQGRASQTVAEIDMLVAPARDEVDKLIEWVRDRETQLQKRIAGLELSTKVLEQAEGGRATSVGAAAAMLIATTAVVVAVGLMLDLSVWRATVAGLVATTVGAVAAYGGHALELRGATLRFGCLAAAGAVVGIAATAIVDEPLRSAPELRKGAFVLLAVAGAAAAFSAAYGVVTSGVERRRRRHLQDARNGLVAAKTELTNFLPQEAHLLSAAAVLLGELASNSCRIARELFVERSAQLIEEADPSDRARLQGESDRLLKELDTKIGRHLENPGAPDIWSAGSPGS